MILSASHFQPQKDAIKDLLLTENEKPRITYFRHKNDYPFTKEELKEWYARNLAAFPLYTQQQGDGVSITNRFRNYYCKYHDLELIKETQTELRKELDGDERDEILLDIDEYIDEWIHNIYIDFAQAIAMAKREPAFACISDDLTVMKNLLMFYSSIRKDADVQLHFFDHTFIPKKVADQMTDVLIILLTDRIKMIEPGYDTNLDAALAISSDSTYKINWLASQQEFGELIHELTDKGYISFPDTPLTIQATNLTRMFDFSASQRKPGANIANNILKVLQPIFDPGTKKQGYSYLKPNYARKFSSILPYLSKNANI